MQVNETSFAKANDNLSSTINFISRLRRKLLSENDINKIKMLLTNFSNDEFESNTWNISLSLSQRKDKIVFPNEIEAEDGILLKAFIINTLIAYGSIATCKRYVYDCKAFYKFLYSKELRIENCRTLTLEAYASFIDSNISLNNSQKNNLMRCAGSLLSFAADYDILEAVGVIDCSRRWTDITQPKRAPDKCVIDVLDSIFFNTGNLEIPDTYRCMYIILRLITNRISEVLAMEMDCISYPDINVYAVSIPTSKETPYHIPIYSKYDFLISGWHESILLKQILLQREFAKSYEIFMDDAPKGYLFVSPQKKDKLVTTKEFNEFLSKICSKYQVLGANGIPTKITSHDLRHIDTVERLQNSTISYNMTMKENNHSTSDQTLGYSYPSINDENERLGMIVKAVYSEDFKFSDDVIASNLVQPTIVRKRIYERLEAQPDTIQIPGHGICCNRSCNPRFENCLLCEDGIPKPEVEEYFESGIKIFQSRLKILNSKKGDKKAVDYNEQKLKLFQKFISRINTIKPVETKEVKTYEQKN